jgi:hypothetical protein
MFEEIMIEFWKFFDKEHNLPQGDNEFSILHLPLSSMKPMPWTLNCIGVAPLPGSRDYIPQP